MYKGRVCTPPKTLPNQVFLKAYMLNFKIQKVRQKNFVATPLFSAIFKMAADKNWYFHENQKQFQFDHTICLHQTNFIIIYGFMHAEVNKIKIKCLKAT